MNRKVSKVWMAVLLASALSASAQLRSVIYTFDAEADQAANQIQHMVWPQTAGVELNELNFLTNRVMDLSVTNLFCTWQIVSSTNVQQTWCVSTGVIVNATSGWVRFTLTPEESNLQTGSYIGFTTAYQASNGTNYAVAPLARQSIRVLFYPDSRFQSTRGPMTYQINAGDVSNLTDAVSDIVDDRVAIELADWGVDYLRTDQILALYIPRPTNSVAGLALLSDGAGNYYLGAPIATNSSMDIGTNTITDATNGVPLWNGEAWPGAEGLQGPPGTNGLDGATGPQGPAGPQGSPGTNGVDGATGPQGPPGTNGLDGATGPQGPPGTNGLNGATGPQGPPGTNGLNGATGPQGPPGTNGLDGAQGPPGTNGINGVNGTNGVGQVGTIGTNRWYYWPGGDGTNYGIAF